MARPTSGKSHGRSASRPGGPHKVRIIGGRWKRTPLTVLDAQGLRPTPDRVRETVFNWLNHLFDADWEKLACLDLFAGSGALGFEAASRGAARVVMVESNAAAVKQLEAMAEKLQAEGRIAVRRSDALAVLQAWAAKVQVGRGAETAAQGAPEAFDVIFLDPPYHHGWMEKILPLCKVLLTERGVVYAEAEQSLAAEDAPAWMKGWEVIRADKAGMVFFHLLRRGNQQEFQA